MVRKNKNIELNIKGQYFLVNIRNVARSKRVKVSVGSNGKIVVSKPYYLSFKLALSFLKEQEDWIELQLNKQKIFSPLLQKNKQIEERANYLKYKEQARKKILIRLEEINKLYGFKYKRVSVRNQKTRWGSCSGQANLNFNYKLIHLPDEGLDYILAHELCHLKEFNHGPEFWCLVAKAVPNYRYWRKKLRNIDLKESDF
jgi:hypothetical protein